MMVPSSGSGASPDPLVRPFIFVLGGPGAGKGTLCGRLAPRFNFCHLSTGDLLRKAILEDCAAKDMIIDYISRGQIVPSSVTVDLLAKAVEDRRAASAGFLVDGFPRNVENHSVWSTSPQGRAANPLILLLDCPEAVMVSRMARRGRPDDNQNTIRLRLETFRYETQPVIAAYRELGRLRVIDADADPQTVFERAMGVLVAEFGAAAAAPAMPNEPSA